MMPTSTPSGPSLPAASQAGFVIGDDYSHFSAYANLAPTPCRTQDAMDLTQVLQDLVESIEQWTRRTNVEDRLAWLPEIYSLVDQRRVGSARELIDQKFAEMLARQDFAGADSVLRAIDAKKLDNSLILAVLAATQRERPNLPHRANLLKRVIEGRSWERDPNEASSVQLCSALFEELAAVWSEEIQLESSASKITEHPAYLQITSIGRCAVPMILDRIKQGERHWGTALRKITGANPLKPTDAGLMAIQNERWLQWGRDQGLIG